MLTPFLTFGVVALHQARLSNLYVEGFVLLVLLVVNYFHLDGFTEEVAEEGKGREKKQREEKEDRKSEENDRLKIRKTGNQETLAFSQASKVQD